MFHFLQGQQQSQTKRERVRCRVVAKHLPIQFNDRPLHRITLHGLDYTSACFQMQINIQLTKDSYMSNEIELLWHWHQVSGVRCQGMSVRWKEFSCQNFYYHHHHHHRHHVTLLLPAIVCQQQVVSWGSWSERILQTDGSFQSWRNTTKNSQKKPASHENIESEL